MTPHDNVSPPVTRALDRSPAGPARALTWDRLRELLVLAALVTSPLSYVIKLIYSLPITWVDPTLILGALAGLLPPWSWRIDTQALRRVALWTTLFVAICWLAATVAAVRMQFPGAEPFREPIRLTLDVLLAVGCLRVLTTPQRVRRIALVLGYVAVFEVITAIYLLLATVLPLPLSEAWRAYQQEYWFRQAFYAGSLVWPRLGGTFVEAPPFGLYVLGSLMVVYAGRRAVHAAGDPMPGRWLTAVLLGGLAGSLSSQVWTGAAVWGLLTLAPRVWTSRVGARARSWYAVATLILLAALSGAVYAKYRQGQQEAVEKGASIGERRAHIALAASLFADHSLIGIGPGQFGEVALRESHGLYEASTNVQFTPAEIPAETGMLGTISLVLLIASLAWALLERRDIMSLAALVGLLIADSFQANWRWPIVFIAISVLLALNLTRQPPRATTS